MRYLHLIRNNNYGSKICLGWLSCSLSAPAPLDLPVSVCPGVHARAALPTSTSASTLLSKRDRVEQGKLIVLQHLLNLHDTELLSQLMGYCQFSSQLSGTYLGSVTRMRGPRREFDKRV
jgi:hypothetical protein